jgi:hypothetical protein
VARSLRLAFQGRDPRRDVDRSVVHRRWRAAIAGVAVAAAFVVALPASAASTTVNLDQWASADKVWQNGNLNGNNSRYPEGGIVPFRLALEGLASGKHSIHINYDFTTGGHKAYDFLATWDVTNAKGDICDAGGGARSSMCGSMPAPSSAAFPSDPYTANGLTVRGAEAYSAAPRRLTIWGGSITSIKGPVHAGSPDGNSTGDFLVSFTSTGPAVLLAWGGHLAQSAYWDTSRGGPLDGAGEVSGAPWHMRTLKLDGSGNKNQDRSIQPSAIVGGLPPFALAPPAPTPRPTTPPAAVAPPAGGTPPRTTPGTPGGGTPVGPTLTLPPTSTVDDARVTLREPALSTILAQVVAVAVAVAAGGAVLLSAKPGRRRRR